MKVNSLKLASRKAAQAKYAHHHKEQRAEYMRQYRKENKTYVEKENRNRLKTKRAYLN